MLSNVHIIYHNCYIFSYTVYLHTIYNIATMTLRVQNFLVYKIAADKMPKFSSSLSTFAKCLSMSESVELVKSRVCERFLSRFAVDYIPNASAYWAPVRLVEGELLELMKRSSQMMVTRDEDGGQEINSLSFAESMLLKTRLGNDEVKLEIQYFGSRLADLVDHTRAHLNRSAAVTRGRNVIAVFDFPRCIDRAAASAAISKDVTGGINSINTNPSAHLSSVKVNRAKL